MVTVKNNQDFLSKNQSLTQLPLFIGKSVVR
jgi:hypothetical protein